MIGPLVALTVTVTRDGSWIPYAPTAALVMLVDPHELCYNPVHDPVSTELLARIKNDGLPRWQSQVLIDRVFAADGHQRDQFLRMRSRWPRGEPIAVSGSPCLGFFHSTRWDDQASVRARLAHTASDRPGPWVDLGGPYLCQATVLGLPASTHGPVRIEAELYTAQGILWRGVRDFKVDRSLAADDLLRPVGDTNTDCALGEWLNPRADIRSSDGACLLWLHEIGREQAFGRYVALGFRVRLLHHGELIAEVQHAMTPPLANTCNVAPDVALVVLETNRPVQHPGDDTGWELELFGDRTAAFLDYDQHGWEASIATDRLPWAEPTEYWAGHVRVPLKMSITGGP